MAVLDRIGLDAWRPDACLRRHGKRQLLPEILKRIPKQFDTYYEPFLGGGAALFALQPERAVVSDSNSELHNLYTTVRDDPQTVLDLLEYHKNTESHFYHVRSWDRVTGWPSNIPCVSRAARTLYLNRTCFNGLYRLNSKGQFNSPYGKHPDSINYDDDNLLAVSMYLHRVAILHDDFEQAVSCAGKGDFVYFDPPYAPISKTSNFTTYTAKGFTWDDQVRLFNTACKLVKKGAYVMLSNSNNEDIKTMYQDSGLFKIDLVSATRVINCNKNGRGRIYELLMTSY
jgi:DNA adenine methylase